MNTLIKNLLIGVGSVLSLFPSTEIHIQRLYKPQDSALESLYGDWAKIKQDFTKALSKMEQTKLNA